MNCPVCRKMLLIPTALEIGLPVSGCTECNGALVSLAAYRYWRTHHAEDAEPASEDGFSPDSAQTLTCPKCVGLMDKYRFSPDDRKIDRCSHCDEVWLDGGEWNALKETHLQLRLTELFSPQWQKAFEDGRMTPHDEGKWRERLGDDFDRVAEFAKWLKAHPNALWVRMYLSREASPD